MEQIMVKKKADDHELFLSWKLDGKGRYELKVPCPFLEESLQILAESADMDLRVVCTGGFSNQEEQMEVFGKLFAEAVCSQCERLYDYRGIGRGTENDSLCPTTCELSLPGRVNWIYEVSIKDAAEDSFAVSKFFSSLAGHAKLRLKFYTYDYSEKYGKAMFAAFGKALKMAYMRNDL